MGRCLLCGKEAERPFEVEELDLRLYTIEELCYYIYHNLPLIDDDFVDDRLISFIRTELDMPEIAAKIERFCTNPADRDMTLTMLLSEVGYYTDAELQEFQSRLMTRKKKIRPERVRMKADGLRRKQRYYSAAKTYRQLLAGPRDGRLPDSFYAEVGESLANCYGYLSEFDRAMNQLAVVYEDTKTERILKKMFEVAVLSGMTPPEKYFSRVPEETMRAWQRDYYLKEVVCRGKVEENETVQLFLKEDADTSREELIHFTEECKENCRKMLE